MFDALDPLGSPTMLESQPEELIASVTILSDGLDPQEDDLLGFEVYIPLTDLQARYLIRPPDIEKSLNKLRLLRLKAASRLRPDPVPLEDAALAGAMNLEEAMVFFQELVPSNYYLLLYNDAVGDFLAATLLRGLPERAVIFLAAELEVAYPEVAYLPKEELAEYFDLELDTRVPGQWPRVQWEIYKRCRHHPGNNPSCSTV